MAISVLINVLTTNLASTVLKLALASTEQLATKLPELVTVNLAGKEKTALNENVPTELTEKAAIKPANAKSKTPSRVIRTMVNATVNRDGAAQHVIDLAHSLSTERTARCSAFA